MRLRLGLALLLGIATACGDDSSDDEGADQPDATVPRDAQGGGGDIDARTQIDARITDSELPPTGPLDAAQLPAMPSSLSVQLRGTACFGTCPSYRVRVDQAGAVTFVGGYCTARPGVFTRSIAASTVQGFYDELRASPYFALRNSYASSDECPTYVLDGPSQLWDVIVDGVRKPLHRDTGCDGVPELLQVDALVPKLLAAAGVEAWRGTGDDCEVIRADGPIGELASSYRLARDGKTLAMLRFGERTFQLEACDGTVLATGTPLTGTYTSFLYDQNDAKLKLGELELGSIALMRPTEQEAVVAYGVREADELLLGIVEAERCTAN